MMKTSKKLINTIDALESRAGTWTLAVDEDIRTLKPYLEKLGYKVLYFGSGKTDPEVHKLLLSKNVDFFITKNGKDYEDYVTSLKRPKNQYSVLWVSENITADYDMLSKVIEKAIMYDPDLKPGRLPRVRKLTAQYVTDSGSLKSKSSQAKKK